VTAIDQQRTERRVEDHPMLHVRPEVPSDLSVLANERGWPDGLLRRAMDLRVPRSDLRLWLEDPQFDTGRVTWLLETLG
jgi:hypothetical protein